MPPPQELDNLAGFSLIFIFTLAGRASKPDFSLARNPFHSPICFLNTFNQITVFSNLGILHQNVHYKQQLSVTLLLCAYLFLRQY